MPFSRVLTACLLSVLASFPLLADDAIPAEGRALVNTWWSANENEEAEARNQLVSAANRSVPLLYRWLKDGPVFSASVPVGLQESYRYHRGARYPYIYVVPKNYDPSKAYPVEFYLHGGVARPEWRRGGDWWLGGEHYERYLQREQISVFPASWLDHPWWTEEQSENLLAILRKLKSTYNIDDNRVFLSGVSDGGTGVFYFAFRQATPWAAFFSYIGHPAVLFTENAIRGDSLDVENLKNLSLYVVNGTDDARYPAESVQPFMDILEAAGVDYQFRVIEDGRHDLRWLDKELPHIEAFKAGRTRDPLPESLRWSSDGPEPYDRIHWLRIDALEHEHEPGWIHAHRRANTYQVDSRGVARFSLLLNPEEIDFSLPIKVIANDETVFDSAVAQSAETLFRWAEYRDRSQLFTAEVAIDLVKE